MKNLEILAISTLFPTDTMPSHGVFVKNRLLAMADIGCDITVVNPIPTSPFHKIISQYSEQQKSSLKSEPGKFKEVIHPRYFSLPAFFKDQEHVFLIKSLKSLLVEISNRSSFDMVDVHWTYPDLPLGIAISKMLNIPCRITLRGMEAFYLNDNDNRKNLIADSLSQVDKIISLSEEMVQTADSLISKLGKKPPMHSVIRNGVDTSVFSYIKTRKEARSELSLDSNIILVGVGSLIKRKGFHHVIGSLGELSKMLPEHLSISYHIIGSSGLEGNYEADLKKLISSLGYNKNKKIKVVLEGKIENNKLPLWYNAADVFCLSSFGEGSPNVLTEALSCGCPSVATNVGSVPDIINSEDDLGIIIPNLVNVDNKKASSYWAKALYDLLLKESYREERSKKMSKYTWQWCAKKAINTRGN